MLPAQLERTSQLNLRAVGFCGIDDTVEPRVLLALSARYPWIEWGVLFHDAKQVRAARMA